MKFIAILTLVSCLFACQNNKETVDMILYNGQVLTLDDSITSATCIVIKDGKILALGNDDIRKQYACVSNQMIDLKQSFVYPGFIDAHCHFYGYAKTLMNCDLTSTKSWQEVIDRLEVFAKKNPDSWLIGRGWDQNDWDNKSFPNNEALNKLFPNRGVFLQRVDGHAAICNRYALDLAQFNTKTKIMGGELIMSNNELTGVILDNAVDSIRYFIPNLPQNQLINALKEAESQCYKTGLTTLADAGLNVETALFLDSLYQQKALSIYQYIMLNPTPNGLKFAQEKGIHETQHLKISSFKLYADGALGSRGAKLKKSYCDQDQHTGLLLNSPEYFNQWCSWILPTGYQVNTHCIGDSANRLLLEIYGKHLKGKNDERWRIEHAQVIDPKDFELFNKFSIIPSVQPTHATSDGPWMEHRLCSHRLRGAYAYQTLLKQNGYIPLGTDFPVEGISPLNTYFSAVFRAKINDPKQTVYLKDESLSPLEALYGITLWAAKACRLEHRKGSLSKGKEADIVVLDKDLLKTSQADFKNIKVKMTISAGQIKHNEN
jgi:predicted amidohydrolase YtcJ